MVVKATIAKYTLNPSLNSVMLAGRGFFKCAGEESERMTAILRKIDCVMLRVDDLDKAAEYYVAVFGLKRLWQSVDSVGLGMPETDAEVVLNTSKDVPAHISVHYLVDNVENAVTEYQEKGCKIVTVPFDIAIGKCAVIEDPFGNQLAILDMTKGARTP
jgi:lactoylglutathione lyase